MAAAPTEPADIRGARVLGMFGDMFTTDHISPIGVISAGTPAAEYLGSLGIAPGDFVNYAARRLNHDVMIRGTFASVRVRNEMTPEVEGSSTVHYPDGARMPIHAAAARYRHEGVPLVVIAGAEGGGVGECMAGEAGEPAHGLRRQRRISPEGDCARDQLPGVSRDVADLARSRDHRRHRVDRCEPATPEGARVQPARVVPTGDADKDFGHDRLGYEINLPFSKIVSDRWTLHFNAGGSLFPNVQDHDLWNYNLGASAIYAVSAKFNLMVESVAFWEDDVDESRHVDRSVTALFSPGARYAFNLCNNAQLVVGLAVPIGLTADSPEYGFFFYCSFEHPFVFPQLRPGK